MKQNSKSEEDDLRPEYDFSKLKGLVRGKYFKRYQAGIMQRHANVEFEFLSAGDKPAILLGTAIVRGDQMVLDVEVEGDRPYSIAGERRDSYYEGVHKGLPGDIPVHAKWTQLDDIWVGTWLEDGIDYLFTFRLTSPDQPERRPSKQVSRSKRK